MLKPLDQWTCDVCGDLIATVGDGYVIWRDDTARGPHDFRVIHKGKCDLPSYTSSLPVADFIGPPGLTKLLSFLSLGPLRARPGMSGAPRINDLDEFVDLVRRFQVPYYEEARRRFSDPDVRSAMDDANEVFPYLPETLKRWADAAT